LFRTKPQIALELIDRALGNGVRAAAWTFDELQGRDGKFLDGLFLDGLEQRQQAFVGEIPMDFHGWVQPPRILRFGPKKSKKRGRGKEYPRRARRRPSCEVRDGHMAIGGRLETRRASQTIRERQKQATIPPASQPASRAVPYENENCPIDCVGNQRPSDQIMYKLTSALTAHSVCRHRFTTKECAKVALPN
jgi:hypothetical protein